MIIILYGVNFTLPNLLCIYRDLSCEGDIGVKSSLYKQRKDPRKIFPLLAKASYLHNTPKYAEP